MGFPACYSEFLLSKPFLHIIFFLGFLRRLISSSFDAIGLGNFLDYDLQFPDSPSDPPYRVPAEFQPMTANLIQEILPAIRFGDLVASEEESDRRAIVDGCVVCLYGFEMWEEVRRLSNCRHVFHRECLDRWVEHDQRICPLCRTPLVPDEMREAFNLRMWAHADVSFSDLADVSFSDLADDFSSLSFISPLPYSPSSPPLISPTAGD